MRRLRGDPCGAFFFAKQNRWWLAQGMWNLECNFSYVFVECSWNQPATYNGQGIIWHLRARIWRVRQCLTGVGVDTGIADDHVEVTCLVRFFDAAAHFLTFWSSGSASGGDQHAVKDG